ncbi:MAG: glycosyltransferase, partial [Candidatus Heimdallarchaeota archaeon]
VSPMVYAPATKEFNVLEAMACGKTLIYVNRMGREDVEELISKGNPIAVNNDQDFAISIIYLLQNERKRKKLGSMGRKAIMRRFSWEKVAKKTIAVYNSLV